MSAYGTKGTKRKSQRDVCNVGASRSFDRKFPVFATFPALIGASDSPGAADRVLAYLGLRPPIKFGKQRINKHVGRPKRSR